MVFDLLARDRASSTVNKVGDSMRRAGRDSAGFGTSVQGAWKTAAGAFAAYGIGDMFAGFITDARESARISRLTEAAITSTGGAANITAGQIGELATALSNKTAIDDEAIQSASNLLLTFTNIRNEAGAGNDIFNQATAAALNMSTAMGTDANAAAMQLGKALNDPIKGVAALGKAGVQFSADQKAQIATMVESGNVMGAQQMILGELSTQFGGAAEAGADPIARLQTVAGNLGEEVGTKLLPHVERFSNWIIDTGIPAMRDGVAWLQRNAGTIRTVAQVVGAVMLPILAAWGIASTVNAAKTVAGWFSSSAAALRGALTMSVSVVRVVAGWALMGARATMAALRVVAGWVLMGAQSLLQAARMAAAWLIAMGPVGWIIAAVVGLVALIIANWDKVKAFTVKAFRAVVDFVVGAWRSIRDGVTNGISAVIGFVTELPGKVLGALGDFGSLLLDLGGDLLRGLWDGISNSIDWLMDKVGDFFGDLLPGWVKDMLGISSPSKVFAAFGRDTMRGFAGGIDDGTGSAVAAAERAAAAVAAVGAGMDVGGSGGGPLGYRPPVYDMSGASGGAVGGATHTTIVSGVASPETVAALVERGQRTTEFLAGAGA